MSGATTELNLSTAVDADDNADYLTIALANSLRTLDALFNSVTGHTHSGAHQGGPVTLPVGSITSAMIVDGTIATADLANASVTNAKLASDTARDNLLANGSFSIWQRGNGAFSGYGTTGADRWTLYPQGSDSISVTKAGGGPNGWGTYASVTHTVSGGGGNVGMAQILKLSDGYNLAGRAVSFSAVISTATAGAVRLSLFDATGGTTIVSGAFHTGGSTWQTLTVTGTVPGACQALWVCISCTATASYFVTNAMLVVGSQAADYAPLQPADEANRCYRYYESIGFVNGSIYFAANAAGASQSFGSRISYVPKSVTPTITVPAGGAWNLTNSAAPVAGGVTPNGFMIQAPSGAAGIMVFSLQAAYQVTIEANP